MANRNHRRYQLFNFFFYSVILLFFFCFQTELIITRTKEDLSYVRSSHCQVSVRKYILKIPEISEKKLLSIFIPTKQVCVLPFVFISSIERVKKPLIYFFFFRYFFRLFVHFLVEGFCIRQYHLMFYFFQISTIKLFSKRINIDYCTNEPKRY